MKKMSDVFELPVKNNDVYISPNLIERSRGASVSNSDVLKHAAHAINHVDALADALDSIIEMAWLISEDLADEFAARPEVIAASKAIAAYRGEK